MALNLGQDSPWLTIDTGMRWRANEFAYLFQDRDQIGSCHGFKTAS